MDAVTVVLGRTQNGSTAGSSTNVTDPTVAILSVSNGQFTAGSLCMATNSSGAGQTVRSLLTVAGTGSVCVTGDVTLGAKSGTATSITATVELAGGALTVLGNMAPGINPTGVTSIVNLNGGALVVTNGAGSGTLQIECGSLNLTNGLARLDRLVMTNRAAAMTVALRGPSDADCAHVVANSQVQLGGTLTVNATGYIPAPPGRWMVLTGTATRTGVFAAVNLPRDTHVVYTPNGFYLTAARGTVLTAR
jgi:hypothetical protein